MEKTAIIALGGNALSNKKQAGTIHDQFSNTRKSLTEITKFLKKRL
jgi:Carbamate kinase